MAEKQGIKHSSVLDQFPEHAKRIALIIANWTAIESIMVSWLAYLLKTDNERSLVLWNEMISIAPKIKLIKRFTRHYVADCDAKEKFLELLGKIQTDSSLRHHYAHAVYSCTPDATTIFISPGISPGNDREWVQPTIPLTLDALNIHIQQLVSLVDRASRVKLSELALVDLKISSSQ